ncbi:MAG: glycosyltransferase family 4 protein [Planctomycetia bacterium]|nr:glycosyltransferase family 4 protein [Planctomycetia bacterium]
MRVGIVIRRFDPARGGAERWTCQLAEHAAVAGHEVHVVAQTLGAGLRRMPIVLHVAPRSRSPLAFAAAAEESLRPLDLDVVHDMGCGWHFDILQPHFGAWRAQLERKLAGSSPAARWLKRSLSHVLPRYRRLDRLVWRQYADTRRLVVAVSKLVARDLERTHGWPMERTRVLYNGVDTTQFAPANREVHRDAVRQRLRVRGDELLVLFVAHNFALKGLPTLLRAIAEQRRKREPVRLLVLGSGSARAYARMARQCGAADAVHFLGPVEDTAPFYAAADAFALPTWYDSCSLVVLEALASGLPVVTSRDNGAGELVTHGVDGYLMDDPGDWRQLSGLIDEIWDPLTRGRVGMAARRLAEQHTLTDNCRRVMAVWEQAAGRLRRAA